MLKLLPYMLLSIAQKSHPLCSIMRSYKLLQVCQNFKWVDCFIKVYSLLGIHITDYSIRMFNKVIVLLEYFCKSLSNMLALCLMLSSTYFAKIYASIIGLGQPKSLNC